MSGIVYLEFSTPLGNGSGVNSPDGGENPFHEIRLITKIEEFHAHDQLGTPGVEEDLNLQTKMNVRFQFGYKDNPSLSKKQIGVDTTFKGWQQNKTRTYGTDRIGPQDYMAVILVRPLNPELRDRGGYYIYAMGMPDDADPSSPEDEFNHLQIPSEFRNRRPPLAEGDAHAYKEYIHFLMEHKKRGHKVIVSHCKLSKGIPDNRASDYPSIYDNPPLKGPLFKGGARGKGKRKIRSKTMRRKSRTMRRQQRRGTRTARRQQRRGTRTARRQQRRGSRTARRQQRRGSPRKQRKVTRTNKRNKRRSPSRKVRVVSDILSSSYGVKSKPLAPSRQSSMDEFLAGISSVVSDQGSYELDAWMPKSSKGSQGKKKKSDTSGPYNLDKLFKEPKKPKSKKKKSKKKKSKKKRSKKSGGFFGLF